MIITNEEHEYLLDSMKRLLDEYDYEWSDEALNTIITTWEVNKAILIEAFKKHQNYIEGKFMIAFDTSFERDINRNAVENFRYWLINQCVREMAASLPPEINQKRLEEQCAWLPNRLFDFLSFLDQPYIVTKTISKSTSDLINEILPNIKAREGQKTSKVVNKICTYLGYDKHPEYNREYAKYADALSPITITRHTVLSINPLDYLTMSFGNSWASCHTIDKENKRGMPSHYSGCYSSGTISYMLDQSSMVFYTVDSSYNGNEYWTQPKITRQMFHWGEEKLVQSRLYPQDNDGDDSAYTPNRNIVQKIMSEIFNFPNLWTVHKGITNASAYIMSQGTHYRDYMNFSNCSLSRIKNNTNEHEFYVGNHPICIQCGNQHSDAENINCCVNGDYYTCSCCGCRIDYDEARFVNGEPYCADCASWCEYCETYHTSEEYYIDSTGSYVCESCYDEYFGECNCCGAMEHNDDLTYIEADNIHVCDSCLSAKYICCDECGQYVRTASIHSYGIEDLCKSCWEERKEQEEEQEQAC